MSVDAIVKRRVRGVILRLLLQKHERHRLHRRRGNFDMLRERLHRTQGVLIKVKNPKTDLGF